MDWEPFRADHSIERVAITLTFATRIDGDVFDDLLILLRKSANALQMNKRVEVSEPLPIEPDAEGFLRMDLTLGPPPSARRVVFQRLTPEGVVIDEVALSVQTFILGTAGYRSWQEFFDLLQKILSALTPISPLLNNLSKVKLEYWDRFVSKNLNADQFEILNRESSLLTNAVRKKSHAFHVHSGWFDFETPNIRSLTNANVDTNNVGVGDAARRNIAVFTLGQVECLKGELDRPLERLSELHIALKTTFRDIISAEAAERVKLGKL
jgi:uncharacterized protein (TIGR04255 family)